MKFKQGQHANEKEMKAKIVLALLETPMLLRNLKHKLRVEYRDLGMEHGVSNMDVFYHLYNEKLGLCVKKPRVVIERNNLLSLNLKNGKALAEIIDILVNDKGICSKLEYLFNRAFIEVFFSIYGDRLLSDLTFIEYLRSKLIGHLFAIYVVEDSKENLSDFEFNLYRSAIYEAEDRILFPRERGLNSWPERPYIKENLSDFDFNQYIRPVLDNQDAPGEELTQKQIDDAVGRIIREYVNKFNLVSVFFDFIHKIRGKTDTEFKLGYILNVIEISLRLEKSERGNDKYDGDSDQQFYQQNRKLDDVMMHKSNDEIIDFLKKAKLEAVNIFVERVIKKAIEGNTKIDNSLQDGKSILNIYYGWTWSRIFIERTEDLIKLSEFIEPKKNITRKEWASIKKKRDALRLKIGMISL